MFCENGNFEFFSIDDSGDYKNFDPILMFDI